MYSCILYIYIYMHIYIYMRVYIHIYIYICDIYVAVSHRGIRAHVRRHVTGLSTENAQVPSTMICI